MLVKETKSAHLNGGDERVSPDRTDPSGLPCLRQLFGSPAIRGNSPRTRNFASLDYSSFAFIEARFYTIFFDTFRNANALLFQRQTTCQKKTSRPRVAKKTNVCKNR
jgi:hypothetical protein